MVAMLSSRRSLMVVGLLGSMAVAVALPAFAAAPGLADPIVDAAVIEGAAAARPVVAGCPGWAFAFAGRPADPLVEISGIVGSRLIDGQWWVHNDSGDTARAFRVDDSMTITAEVDLDGVAAFDIEDIAYDPAEGYLWLADTGDNLRIRASVALYGFPEPPASTRVSPRVVTITYADGLPHDVEAFLIDPLTGNGFLVAKGIQANKTSIVYRVPAAVLRTGGPAVAERVASIDVAAAGTIGPTGGDISPDGSMIVVKTFTTTMLWPRQRGQSVAEVFAAQPVAPCIVADGGNNEAIGFARDGRRMAAVSEGTNTRLRLFTRT